MTKAIKLRNISKSFGDVKANDNISLAVDKGEIRALVGENGAGKTTLMNILYGLYQPDSGDIFIKGEKRRFKSPLDAIHQGLGMVHQHFMLFSKLSVLENIIYGMEPSRAGFIDKARAREEVLQLSKTYNLVVNPDAKVANLSVGVRQRVEILKALYREAEILIFDEPTSVLTPQEQGTFFKVLRRLAKQGKTIIFITHKLNEVMEISDNISVMRDGKITAFLETEKTNTREICRHMVGRDVLFELDQDAVEPGQVVLEVNHLNMFDEDLTQVLRGVSFKVREGEIVGISGVAGNGQEELIRAITGLAEDFRITGSISMNGREITRAPVSERRKNGLSYIPEDRTATGLALPAKVSENLIMGYFDRPLISRGPLLNHKGIREFSRELVETYSIKTSSVTEAVANLSGGNLQKVIVGRELHHKSKFLVAEQPTRGVDVGSIEFIHRFLLDHRKEGNAILLVSTELNEIMSLSDRILVMYEGKIIGEVSRNEADRNEIGLMMAGVRKTTQHE